MNEPILTIVVPCYNEEEVLPYTFKELKGLMSELVQERLVSDRSRLLFVDDGSIDQTWTFIYKETIQNQYVRGLKLARNVGHQNALLAGLFKAKELSDCIISIDADLQDDCAVIKEFLKKYKEGYEIVYGVRVKRESDTFFKRTTAQSFYKLMKLMGVDLVYNHADFRLMSKRSLSRNLKNLKKSIFFTRYCPVDWF